MFAKYECCWNSCRVKKALRRLVAGGVLVAVWHQHMCFLDCSQRKVELERRAEIWTPGLAREGRERRMGQETHRRVEPELWRESCQLEATLRHGRHTNNLGSVESNEMMIRQHP